MFKAEVWVLKLLPLVRNVGRLIKESVCPNLMCALDMGSLLIMIGIVGVMVLYLSIGSNSCYQSVGSDICCSRPGGG